MSFALCNKIGASAIGICDLVHGNNREVAVYGATRFGWNTLEIYLRQASDTNKEKYFKKVYTYQHFTLLRTFSFSGKYKASLSEIVLRNYKSIMNDDPRIISVLFCVGINSEILTPEQIMSKRNDDFTPSELRRAIKHCIPSEMLFETPESPESDTKNMQLARDLAQIAIVTFHAISVITTELTLPNMPIKKIEEIKVIPNFFTNKEYPKLLAERREEGERIKKELKLKGKPLPPKKDKSQGWKKQFYNLVLDTTYVPPPLESPMSPTSVMSPMSPSSLMSPRSSVSPMSPTSAMSPMSPTSLMSPRSSSVSSMQISLTEFPEIKEAPTIAQPKKSKWYSKFNPFKK